jgi:hypothetical protein
MVKMKGEIMRKKPSKLFDFIMFILTGGFWFIWVIIRYLRSKTEE